MHRADSMGDANTIYFKMRVNEMMPLLLVARSLLLIIAHQRVD